LITHREIHPINLWITTTSEYKPAGQRSDYAHEGAEIQII
jgi:hypothetical protein